MLIRCGLIGPTAKLGAGSSWIWSTVMTAKPDGSEEHLPHCHFAHPQSNMSYTCSDPGFSGWKPEACHLTQVTTAHSFLYLPSYLLLFTHDLLYFWSILGWRSQSSYGPNWSACPKYFICIFLSTEFCEGFRCRKPHSRSIFVCTASTCGRRTGYLYGQGAQNAQNLRLIQSPLWQHAKAHSTWATRHKSITAYSAFR
jgi:hypothetical protein